MKNVDKSGAKILKENDYFINLHRVMSNTNFRTFLNKYGKDWSDIKVMMLYVKLYESIENYYYDKYGRKIPEKLLMVVLREMFVNSEIRKIIMKNFHNFTNNLNTNYGDSLLDYTKDTKIPCIKDI